MKSKELLVTEAVTIPKVEEVPLEAHERETGFKAIVDKSNMNTLCVVPNDNQIVQHSHVIDEVSKLDNYVIAKTMLMKNGNKLMIELKEQTPQKIELLPNDFMECGARVYNDYTKNRGLSVQGFGIRLVCSNGMVAPVKTKSMDIHAFGTAEFNTELEKNIANCISVWTDTTELMEQANSKIVSIKDVTSQLPRLAKKYHDKIMDELKDQDTIYNIWNQYTQVITHEIGPNVSSQVLIKLQKRANSVLKLVETV